MVLQICTVLGDALSYGRLTSTSQKQADIFCEPIYIPGGVKEGYYGNRGRRFGKSNPDLNHRFSLE